MTDSISSRSLTRRGVLGLAGLGASAAALSACSGPSTTSGGPGGQASEGSSDYKEADFKGVKPAKEIEFWSIHPGSSIDTETEIVNAWNSSQSDTTVRLITAGNGYPAIVQKFQAAQAGGKLPGLLTISGGTWFNFYLNKAIIPVDGLLDAVGNDSSDFIDSFWTDYSFRDRAWMVPYARSTPIFYYNKSYFKQAGLPDRGPKTWEEFADWGPKFAKADTKAKHLFAVSGTGYSWDWQGPIWAFGGRYSDKFDFMLSDKGTIAAHQFIHDGVFKDKWAGVAGQAQSQDFATGVAGAIIESTGYMGGILKTVSGQYDIGTAFLPAGPAADDFVCTTGGSGLAIPSKISKEEQVAAARFAKFATSAENTVKFSIATGYMPVRKSADTSKVLEKTPEVKTALDQLPHTKAQDYARMFVPGGIDVLNDAFTQTVLHRDADLDSIMAAGDKKLEKIYETQVKPYLD